MTAWLWLETDPLYLDIFITSGFSLLAAKRKLSRTYVRICHFPANTAPSGNDWLNNRTLNMFENANRKILEQRRLEI